MNVRVVYVCVGRGGEGRGLRYAAKHIYICNLSEQQSTLEAQTGFAPCIQPNNKTEGRIIPFLAPGFWDKTRNAGAMPRRRDFPATTRILSLQAKPCLGLPKFLLLAW